MWNKPSQNKPDILTTSAIYWLYATRPITGVIIVIYIVAGIVTGDLHLAGALILGSLALFHLVIGSWGKNKAKREIEALEKKIKL